MESCLIPNDTYVEKAFTTCDFFFTYLDSLMECITPVKRAPTRNAEFRPKRASDSRAPSSSITDVSRNTDDETQLMTARLTEITDVLQRQFESRLAQVQLDFQTQLTSTNMQLQTQQQQYQQQLAMAQQVSNQLRAEVREAQDAKANVDHVVGGYDVAVVKLRSELSDAM